MRKTWKSAIAMASAAAVVMTGINWPLTADAKVFRSDNWSKVNGLDVKLDVMYNGSNENAKLYSGSINDVFDGDFATTATFSTNNDTGSICQNDYIQVTFKNPVNFTSASFYAALNNNEDGDWFQKVDFQYQITGEDTWQSLSSMTYDGELASAKDVAGKYVTKYSGTADTPIKNVTAIRLLNTEELTASKDKWLKLSEIEIDAVNAGISVTQAPSKTVYKTGDTLSAEDLNGLIVSKYDETGSLVETNSYTTNIADIDMNTPGTKTVTVSADGYTASFDLYVYAPGTDAYPTEGLTVSVGEGVSQDGAGIENAFDGNTSTTWHTAYYPEGHANQWKSMLSAVSDAAITMKFQSPTVVSALNYKPIQGNNTNGIITKYRIEGSEDGETFYTLSEGTWANTHDDKTANFMAAELKAIRLVPVAANSGHVTATEITLTTAAEEADALCIGTSLKWSYQEEVGYTRTGLRFGYKIPKAFNGMNIVTWSWDYGIRADELSSTNIDLPNSTASGDMLVTNLVIGGTGVEKAIKAEYYGDSYFARIKVTYQNTEGTESVTIYSPLREDTILGWADRAIESSSNTTDKMYVYAQGLKAAYEAVNENGN